MSDQPTPEQILLTHHIECTGPGEVSCGGCRDAGWMTWTGYYRHLLAALAEYGYVIVHLDDSDGSADIDGQTYLLFDVRSFGADQ